MFKRLLYALQAFKFAWKEYNDQREWDGSFINWKMNKAAFKIMSLADLHSKTVERINHIDLAGRPDLYANMGHEINYVLRKRCVDKDGNVRFFEVVPGDYEFFDYEKKYDD